MIIGKFILVTLIGYLIGAIPFAFVISKRIAGIDISKHGSGNISGTNVLHVLGLKAGAIALTRGFPKFFEKSRCVEG